MDLRAAWMPGAEAMPKVYTRHEGEFLHEEPFILGSLDVQRGNLLFWGGRCTTDGAANRGLA
jgi:hypothetical protein